MALGQLAGAFDAELAEQELELRLQRAADRLARVRWQAPQLALEEAQRLLAGLVEELLVRVAALALVRRHDAQPLVDLALEAGREARVIEQHVLELGREMDLDRS